MNRFIWSSSHRFLTRVLTDKPVSLRALLAFLGQRHGPKTRLSEFTTFAESMSAARETEARADALRRTIRQGTASSAGAKHRNHDERPEGTAHDQHL